MASASVSMAKAKGRMGLTLTTFQVSRISVQVLRQGARIALPPTAPGAASLGLISQIAPAATANSPAPK